MELDIDIALRDVPLGVRTLFATSAVIKCDVL